MQESDCATRNLMASDLEEMARLCVTFYDHACEWKDQARRSPEYEPLFLAACEGNMRATTYAEILSCHLENRILRQNYCALRYYYHYEAMSCQIPFLKNAKVEEEIQCLKDMSAVLEKGIEALGNCEDMATTFYQKSANRRYRCGILKEPQGSLERLDSEIFISCIAASD